MLRFALCIPFNHLCHVWMKYNRPAGIQSHHILRLATRTTLQVRFQCCFTSTGTVRTIRDCHLDLHTASELWVITSFSFTASQTISELQLTGRRTTGSLLQLTVILFSTAMYGDFLASKDKITNYLRIITNFVFYWLLRGYLRQKHTISNYLNVISSHVRVIVFVCLSCCFQRLTCVRST